MKKLLISLFVGFVGIISFSSANTINISVRQSCYSNFDNPCYFSEGDCFLYSNSMRGVYFYDSDGNNVSWSWEGLSSSSAIICPDFDGYYIYSGSTSTNIGSFKSVYSPCPDCPTCDSQYTSLECQTEYNLIPINEVDINYCVGNGLCPTEMGSGDYTGDLQYSNLYINDILHPGKQNIFVNIPDYITWDYNFTGDDFNLDVGSGYDVDYINSVIDINSYRPTSEDFTNVFVSGLTLVMPYIVIVLFIVFIRKLIKRIFK